MLTLTEYPDIYDSSGSRSQSFDLWVLSPTHQGPLSTTRGIGFSHVKSQFRGRNSSYSREDEYLPSRINKINPEITQHNPGGYNPFR